MIVIVSDYCYVIYFSSGMMMASQGFASGKGNANRVIVARHFILFCCAIYTVAFLYCGYLSATRRAHEFACISDSDTRNSNFSEVSSLPFSASMREFAWLEFERAILSKDLNRVQQFSDALFLKLLKFVKAPPPIPQNETCHPPSPKLTIGSEGNCTRLKSPRRVGMLLQFGFDVDALEVHLHELDAVVDKFFIVESTLPHSHFFKRKPLIWDDLKYDQRFAQFLHKIVHFVVDDATYSTQQNATATPKDIWELESLQEKFRWIKFMEWNSKTNYFTRDDLLGFGDTDEIPNRNNVFTLKHCEIPFGTVDIGIWFPFPYIDTIFKTDFPVEDHPYTLGDPTFWTLSAAMEFYNKSGRYPTRMRGKSPSYLLGGLHMSKYPFPPYQMLKLLTASEALFEESLSHLIEIGMLYSNHNNQTNWTWASAAAKLNNIPGSIKFKSRIRKLSEFNATSLLEMESIVKLPWFIHCNPERYPSLWENGVDLRLLG